MAEGLGSDERGVNVMKYLTEFTDELLRKVKDNVRCIVVFGSRARGDWKPSSDLDVLVVLKAAPKSFERLKLLPCVPLVEAWAYTEEEFYEALRKFDLALLDALEHGKVAYGGFWREARELFKHFKREWELEELEHGWISRRIERKALRRRHE